MTDPDPAPRVRQVPVRDNSHLWPPTPDEYADVPADTATHWDDRLWRRAR